MVFAAMRTKTSGIPSGFNSFANVDGYIGRNGPYYCKERDAGGFDYGFLPDHRHGNPNDVIHGAALLGFVDTAFGHLVVASTQRYCATVSLNTDFIGATDVGSWVDAEVYLKKLTGSMAFVGAEVSCGDKLLLSATAIFRLFAAYKAPG